MMLIELFKANFFEIGLFISWANLVPYVNPI